MSSVTDLHADNGEYKEEHDDEQRHVRKRLYTRKNAPVSKLIGH